MDGRHRSAFLTIAATMGLALACSSPSNGAPDITAQKACDDYFDALVGVACNATTPPDDELTRIRALFDTVCQNSLALPGNGLTAGSLEACAKAVGATGCASANLDIPECSAQGSLPDGAACNESSQCQSGACSVASTAADAGPSIPACGVCVPGVAVGQPCATGDKCAYGAVCAASGAGFACTAVTYGDAGATCDLLAAGCKTGLYCDIQAKQCTSPGAADAACTGTQACSPPLTCVAGEGGPVLTCQPPAPAGGACQIDQDCQAGLGCSPATSQCAAITWVAPGQTCSALQHCLVGFCPIVHGPGGAGGKCPTVISDGQACTRGDASHTCDTFSACLGGICQQPDSVVCQ
jgi:hypothetical protein